MGGIRKSALVGRYFFFCIGICGGLASAGAAAEAAQPADTVESLVLPVPRTFELTHVRPELFAAALGNDPERIFAFVRDQIAYEAYQGYLRGPRGTLLALAGNSVDQAALLDAMLAHAGQQVRYVQGELSQAEAKRLIDSMWVERPRPTLNKGAPSPELEAALGALHSNIERDYRLIRDHLKRAGHKPGPKAATSLAALLEETRDHYWVQLWKDGAWVDLDPSFGEAKSGRTFAQVGSQFEDFPENLFHRVEIRIRIEECSGDVCSERTLLKFSAKAADLSNVDLVLAHQPENWKGPAASPQAALVAAIEDTGRIKPVCIVGNDKWEAGEPFRQKLPALPTAGRGLGSFKDLIGGAGTRKPVPVATAQWIEFDFIYPDGRSETVVREIFDLAERARRATGMGLTAGEVQELSESDGVPSLTEAFFELFFTTGSIDQRHLIGVANSQGANDDQQEDIRKVLQVVNVAFTAAVDGLLKPYRRFGDATFRFYPDTPRLQITELLNLKNKVRLALDLRRPKMRAGASDSDFDQVFFAQVYRGVLEGSLERALMDILATFAMRNGPRLEMGLSTSRLIEQAHLNGIPIVLMTSEGEAHLDSTLSDNARARIREDLDNGYFVVAPERALESAELSRFAWWRIDRKSGETIAVTDAGLHQDSIAWALNEKKMAIYIYVTVGTRTTIHVLTAQNMSQLNNWVNYLLNNYGLMLP